MTKSTFLIAAIASGLLLASVGVAQDAAYIGHDQCKVCHNKKPEGEQWNVWKKMKHASAFEALKTDQAKEVAKEKGLAVPPEQAPECLRCHVTAYDVEKKAAPAKIKVEMGVQCETCHGGGAEHLKDGRQVMFKKSEAGDIDWMANLLAVKEADCRKCHNEESPTWDSEKYTILEGEKKGQKVGFDFEQAKAKVSHPNPKKAEPAAEGEQ
jgi:hypothetical protein